MANGEGCPTSSIDGADARPSCPPLPASPPRAHLRAEGEASLLRGLYSEDRSESPSSLPVTPVRAERCASQSGSTPAPRRSVTDVPPDAVTWMS